MKGTTTIYKHSNILTPAQPDCDKDKSSKNAQLISDESESRVFAVAETQDNTFWFESKTVAHIDRS
jgi:hypothetical protein